MLRIFSVAVFFFFKQKTAYEWRISDWSSDLCSSDLVLDHGQQRVGIGGPLIDLQRRLGFLRGLVQQAPPQRVGGQREVAAQFRAAFCFGGVAKLVVWREVFVLAAAHVRLDEGQARARARQQHQRSSEEHPSELQSLMRISYAVFCLKKKNK